MFSNNNLHILLRDSPAFRYVLEESLNNKNEIFANYLKQKNSNSKDSFNMKEGETKLVSHSSDQDAEDSVMNNSENEDDE